MTNAFWQYYGMDWVSAVSTLLGMYYIGGQKRIGFLFNIAGVASCAVVYVMAHTLPLLLLNAALLFLNARGYVKWKHTGI